MQLGDRQWPQVYAETNKVVVVPIGSFEQHGHHLPLLTDSIIGGEIARRVEAELADEALFVPFLWLGASDHHLNFPGTISLSVATYTQVLIELVESLLSAGFRKVLLLNSHAGNVIPGQAALLDATLRHRAAMPDLWLVFASWFEIAREAIATLDGFEQKSISHACEWETSIVQTVRPELVGDDRPAARFDIGSAFYHPDYRAASRVYPARTIEQNSASGAFGYPESAGPHKGEELLETAVREIVAFVRELRAWPTVTGR
jgi:creatinine amidohydrolase